MDYEPIARLGRGGMGVVDLARDADGNKVALKRLTLHGSASEIMQARQRLLREAKVLRRLRHPNIVRLLDVVEDDDEIVLVMPYLPGGSLAERVAQHGPAPPPEVERLGQRLIGALVEAHAAGIIHRDIKPANVLYDAAGEPLLVDFGLAYTWDQSQPLTVAGMVVGTPGFIAPEQARGEPLTPSSDVFSLGATLLFAATGGGPFGNGDPGLLMVKAASGKVERVPKRLPAPLRRRLTRMLDPRPERRPTPAAMLAAADEPARRRPSLAILGGVAATVLVATIVVVSTRDDGPDGGRNDETGGPPNDLPGDSEPPDQSGPGATPGDTTGNGGDDDPDDGRELVSELSGTVAPGDDVDTYRLPLAEDPGTACPREVEIQLELANPRTHRLSIEVYVDQQSADRRIAYPDAPAVVTFDPNFCADETVEVVVEAAGALDAQTYVLTRTDRL